MPLAVIVKFASDQMDDRNANAIAQSAIQLWDKLFGDKGYISKALTDILFGNGIQLITAVRREMKSKALSNQEKNYFYINIQWSNDAALMSTNKSK